jgi:tetratricopeptide (TPR) repeat protein
MQSIWAHFTLMPLLALAALAACEGHGTYTSKFLEEAEENRARLRAATEYDQAVQRFQSGDLEQALEIIDRSIALNDQAALGYLLRGRILLEMGQSDAAVATLEHGVTLGPAEPGFYYYRGIAFERVGRIEEALSFYRAAATIEPSNPQYILAVAETLVELTRLDEARELLLAQTGDLESSPGLRQELGHIAMLEEDYEQAIRYFREASVLAPDEVVFREDLCHAQVAAEHFAKAEATLRRLAREEDFENRRDLLHLQVSCLIELDRAVEARSILYRLVRSEDGAGDTEAWVKLIDVALMLRDDGLLRMVANRMLATAPGRYEGYLALAMWQRRNGDLEGALRSLDRAIQRAGEDPAPRRFQAVVLGELDRDSG